MLGLHSTIALALLVLSSMTLAQDRAATAKLNTTANLRALCTSKGITFPPKRVFLRALKQEQKLEVWASNGATSKLVLLKVYPVLAASGELGPKRKEGDGQVPEGAYFINRFNPASRFHLSLGLNYPNKSDLILGDKERPGSDIFIHGSNVSIGCLAMGDPAIEEIYTLSRSCRAQIPVLILPQRKIEESTDLWKQLKAINSKFDSTHFFPTVTIDAKGNYVIR